MTSIVDLHQARTHLARLLDRAHAGEEIILAKAGKPYAVPGPLPPPEAVRRPGRLSDQFVGPEILDSLPPTELDAWEGR